MPATCGVEYEDSKVLVLQKGLADALQDVTIDVEDIPVGAKLVISGEA